MPVRTLESKTRISQYEARTGSVTPEYVYAIEERRRCECPNCEEREHWAQIGPTYDTVHSADAALKIATI